MNSVLHIFATISHLKFAAISHLKQIFMKSTSILAWISSNVHICTTIAPGNNNTQYDKKWDGGMQGLKISREKKKKKVMSN